jgi:hypothetical protein
LSTLRALAVVAAITSVAATARADDEPGHDLPPIPAREIHAPEAPADFLVETRGFLRIVYHPSAFEAVRRIASGADAVRASLATTLGQSVLENVEVRIARTSEEMALLAPADAPPSAHSTSAAYPSLSLVVLSIRNADGVPGPLDEAFHHQLAHVALADASAGRPLPRWLHEGFAVYASGEATLARTQILWTADVRKSLLPFASLDAFPTEPRAARIAWAESADFVRYLDRDGTRFAAAIARARTGDPLDRALTDAYGKDLRGLEQSWRDDLTTRCVTLPLGIGAGAGWLVAIGALVARRRRKSRARASLVAETELPAPALDPPSLDPGNKSEPRLLVCDRGLGHVAYIVAGKAVPNVEHEGKRHTLH